MPVVLQKCQRAWAVFAALAAMVGGEVHSATSREPGAPQASAEPASAEEAAPFPGERSLWHGYDRYDFEFQGKPVLVVVPKEPAAGKPWAWYGEFFGTPAKLDDALLERGLYLVHIALPDQFGSPAAVEHWNKLYANLTQEHGLSPRPALIGVSRGGLYCYNWASQNPQSVSCIYGDAPVCDLHSWPLGLGTGSGNSNEVPKLLAVYEAANTEELFQKALNPIDLLEPLAKAKVPLLHVYGDADRGVPWDENTGIVAERYKALGGSMELIAKPGVGHVHGLDDLTPVVEFICGHAGK